MAAMMCPCGCGTKAPIFNIVKRGAVVGALRCNLLLEFLNSLASDESISDLDREGLRVTSSELGKLYSDLLAHAHGVASPLVTPNLAELSSELRMWEAKFSGAIHSAGLAS